MTNTTYFPQAIRDDAYTSSSSEDTWQQQDGNVASVGASSSSSSSSSKKKLYSVIGKRINAWISPRSGVNPNVSTTARKDHGSSRKCSSMSVPPVSWTEGELLESPNLKSFTLKELKTATNNFEPGDFLGEGGFGQVYKGWIDEISVTATKPGRGIAVAVKKLNQEGFQGHSEWLAEVKYLGQLYHPNLVRLCGYCLDNEKRLLVYEFMARGSLENHLFRRGSCLLSWSLRMKIMLGAAKGLAFLHRSDVNVIHRGMKSSNILLDSNYNAKISDLGLARDGPDDGRSHVTTRIMGTYGYAAPEYVCTGHLTAKSDVYSFGVVLLEVLSGRRAMDRNRSSAECNLVQWAKPFLNSKRKIFRVLDNHLEGKYSLENALKAAKVALKCLANDAKIRPNMNEVVTAMEQFQDP